MESDPMRRDAPRHCRRICRNLTSQGPPPLGAGGRRDRASIAEPGRPVSTNQNASCVSETVHRPRGQEQVHNGT